MESKEEEEECCVQVNMDRNCQKKGSVKKGMRAMGSADV